MEFTLQSYEILIIGLMVMGLFLAIIPCRARRHPPEGV